MADSTKAGRLSSRQRAGLQAGRKRHLRCQFQPARCSPGEPSPPTRAGRASATTDTDHRRVGWGRRASPAPQQLSRPSGAPRVTIHNGPAAWTAAGRAGTAPRPAARPRRVRYGSNTATMGAAARLSCSPTGPAGWPGRGAGGGEKSASSRYLGGCRDAGRSRGPHVAVFGHARPSAHGPAPTLFHAEPRLARIRSCWGWRSAGRASRSQCEGREFDHTPSPPTK